ncbi:MAG TPA: MEDS domain-containing protein [Amycolatopsis sp.]|jgi:hypothetical protein|nr:MEDS domain-containing protein [Amycolatopsis sp.]
MAETRIRDEAWPGLVPGDHACGFYLTEAERDGVLNAYLRDGLSRGDKCFCAVNSSGDSESLLDRLGHDVDLAPILARHQLDVCEAADVYLRDGQFSGEVVTKFWEDMVSTALSSDFSFARVTGEVPRAPGALSNVDEFMIYEAQLNWFVPRHPQVFLCLYELSRFDGETLVDVLKVHRKVFFGGILTDNPYYVEPEEFLAARQKSTSVVSH